MLELSRVILFLASTASAAACVAMQFGRLGLHPSLRVAAYALPVVVVLLIIVAGLRAPRFVVAPRVPLVLKVLGAASESADGRRAVTSVLFAGYAVAVAIAWRRVPKRPARL
jgi:hypothetical protein